MTLPCLALSCRILVCCLVMFVLYCLRLSCALPCILSCLVLSCLVIGIVHVHVLCSCCTCACGCLSGLCLLIWYYILQKKTSEGRNTSEVKKEEDTLSKGDTSFFLLVANCFTSFLAAHLLGMGLRFMSGILPCLVLICLFFLFSHCFVVVFVFALLSLALFCFVLFCQAFVAFDFFCPLVCPRLLDVSSSRILHWAQKTFFATPLHQDYFYHHDRSCVKI